MTPLLLALEITGLFGVAVLPKFKTWVTLVTPLYSGVRGIRTHKAY